MIRSGSWNGKPRNMTPLTIVKTALLAPMPSASAVRAASVNHRPFKRTRVANRRSCHKPCTSMHRRGQGRVDDLAVKQVDGALRMTGITRIVRHHANRRARGMKFAQQFDHRLAAARVE